ncbi:MAG: RNA polymerase subunit sigma, partial [Ruminococcaceae bacterium]|nr:RNA polymerase subunit sigma [Oscillospiraceae bacterium]
MNKFLLKGVSKLDSENVSVLFCKYGDDVFRLALSYLKCREDAEDVCQNVFL